MPRLYDPHEESFVFLWFEPWRVRPGFQGDEIWMDHVPKDGTSCLEGHGRSSCGMPKGLLLSAGSTLYEQWIWFETAVQGLGVCP